MKTFHHKHGAPALTTLTVGELRAALANYPDDMPVLSEWEGQRMPIGASFQVEQIGMGVISEACECLVIDAEVSPSEGA